MVLKLNSSDNSFERDFTNFLDIKRDEEKNVDDEVRAIIQQLRDKGDLALKSYTQKFDNFHAESLKIEPEKLQQAYESSSRHYLQAMQMAVQRVTDFHQKTYPEGIAYQD
ncbi:MAG: histidinol dehydrogenase, partial [Alphaproteobacteria bacterium]|nr:histidinol dehydrogenase [Alphaproteobacteria bacterium]